MKKLLLVLGVLAVLVTFVALSPRFIFVKAGITRELNLTIEAVPLDISWEGIEIVDYRGRWGSMYAKLELSPEKYEQVQQKFLLFYGSKTNRDFSGEISNGESRYEYDEASFSSMLMVINRVKDRGAYHSMNLDDCEELLIIDTTYGKMVFLAGTTGSRRYILAKEGGGNCYLYIIKI